MIRKTIAIIACSAAFLFGANYEAVIAQPLDAPAAKFLAQVDRAREAETPQPRLGKEPPIFEPAQTYSTGDTIMLDVPSVPIEKLDVAIIGGSYRWDGRQVAFTPKQLKPRLLFDGFTQNPLLLLPSNRELAGNYHVVIVGGPAVRIIPVNIVDDNPVVVVPPGPGPVPPGPVPPGPEPPPVVVPSKVTAATYVYEKDQHAIPNQVLAALNRINRELKITATLLEADTKDGTGEVPEQYRLPLAAAKEAGLPALVVTGGGKVIRTVKAPTTEQQVLDAVK